MFTILRSSSPVLVMLSTTSVLTCIYNNFYARQANSRQNNHFLEGYLFLTPACAGLLEPRGSGLKLLKSTFNAKDFIHRYGDRPKRCLGLSPAISMQFTLELRVASQNRKKFTRTPYFSGSRSSR